MSKNADKQLARKEAVNQERDLIAAAKQAWLDEKPRWYRWAVKTFRLTLLSVLLLSGAVWISGAAGLTKFHWVTGSSMEPTISKHSWVVSESVTSPEIGDAIVFTVPSIQVSKESGAEFNDPHVVHRIIDGDGINGWVTQGDNNTNIDDFNDNWLPTHVEVVGSELFNLPSNPFINDFLFHPYHRMLVQIFGGMVLTMQFAFERRFRTLFYVRGEITKMRSELKDEILTAIGTGTVNYQTQAPAVPDVGPVTSDEAPSIVEEVPAGEFSFLKHTKQTPSEAPVVTEDAPVITEETSTSEFSFLKSSATDDTAYEANRPRRFF